MNSTGRITIPAAEEILNQYFPVLDHGFVALVDYMGGDSSVVRAARTSYGAGTKSVSEDRTLTRYLSRNRHASPFEMTEMVFHMGLPIFVARQLVRHRTASLNEYSGRYSQMPMLFYRPDQEHLQLQAKSNKQGRAGVVSNDVWRKVQEEYERNEIRSVASYEAQLGYDVARELARIDLPLSTYTYWYWKMDLRNMLHCMGLRADSHAQYEIRAFANVMCGMVQRLAPDAFEAFIDYELCSARFSRQEMKWLRSYFFESEKGAGRLVVGDMMKADGISQREVDEFFAKMKKDYTQVPDFTLDLTQAKPGSFFEEKIAQAVPAVDL